MEFRYLGNSGFKISEIIYGNWLTHASQVENDVAKQCVQAALDAGITTFDTADAYANTEAERVLGDALKGQRRSSLEIFTKVYWPTGPKGHNDVGLSRKHIMESIDGSLERLGTDYVDLYQAHRFDYETPIEETMQAFADVVRAGKALYIGVSEWNADQLRAGHKLARDLGIQFISNQPQYSMLWRVIEIGGRSRRRPSSASRRSSGRRSPRACSPASTSRGPRRRPAAAPRMRRVARTRSRASCATTSSRRCRNSSRSPTSSASPWRSSPSRGCCRTRTWPARSSALRARSRSRRTRPLGITLGRRARPHRPGRRRRRRDRSGSHRLALAPPRVVRPA